MQWHPRQGALAADAAVGLRPEPMQPGWNRQALPDAIHPEIFTFIGDDEGLTTFDAPDVDPSLIYEVGPPPPLEESILWRELQQCADELAEQDAPACPAERVRAVMASIAAAGAASDGIRFDRDTWRQWAGQAMARMRAAAAAGSYDDFVAPAFDVVRAYLDFELPGMLARDLLAGVLTMQCDVPRLGPPSTAPQAGRIAVLDWLADQTYALLVDRRDADVTSHAEMTYLLALYAHTCAALWGAAEETGEPIPGRDRAARVAQATEERGAHHAVSAFVLPAMMTPADILVWVSAHSYAERDPAATAEHYALPPSLTALLGSLTAPAAQLTATLQADSAGRPARAVRDELSGALTPIAPGIGRQAALDLAGNRFDREHPPWALP